MRRIVRDGDTQGGNYVLCACVSGCSIIKLDFEQWLNGANAVWVCVRVRGQEQ